MDFGTKAIPRDGVDVFHVVARIGERAEALWQPRISGTPKHDKRKKQNVDRRRGNCWTKLGATFQWPQTNCCQSLIHASVQTSVTAEQPRPQIRCGMFTRPQRQAMTDAFHRLRNWAYKVPTVAFISPSSCLVFLATPAHIFRTRRQRCVPNLTTAYHPLHPRSAISCTVTPPLPLCRVCHCTLSENTALTELSKADCGQVEGITVVLS